MAASMHREVLWMRSCGSELPRNGTWQVSRRLGTVSLDGSWRAVGYRAISKKWLCALGLQCTVFMAKGGVVSFCLCFVLLGVFVCVWHCLAAALGAGRELGWVGLGCMGHTGLAIPFCAGLKEV